MQFWNGAVKLGWAIIILTLPHALLSQKSDQNEFCPEAFITPLPNYSSLGKALAMRYEPELILMALRAKQELKTDRIELLDWCQSPSASIGFRTDPYLLAADARFLSLSARVNIKLHYFPDNDWGRMGDAIDAFGKDLLKVLGRSLDSIPENSVRGVALVLIYSKQELNDPGYYDYAEALVIFIPRDTLKKFNSCKLTLNRLLEDSDIYAFKGSNQIQLMLTDFLRG